MKHLNLLTLCLAVLFFAAPLAVSAADAPDAYAYSNLARGFDSKLVKFIASQPEWKPLIGALTQKIDAAYPEARNAPGFPKEFVDMALDKIRLATGKSEFSSKEILEVLRYEFEAVLVSLWAPPQSDKPEVALSVFMRFDPVELEDFLKLLPPSVYNQVKKDSSGTIYRFTVDGNTVYAGHTQLARRGDYLLAVSEHQSRVEQQLAFAKSDEFQKTVLASSGPFGKIEITPAYFNRAREMGFPMADPNVAQVLENIEGLSLYTEDTSESTVTRLAVTMKKEEDAKDLKDTAEGFVAMIRMFASFNPDIDENGKRAIGLLSQIKFDQDAKTLRVSVSYNTPEFESVLKEFLVKALEELTK